MTRLDRMPSTERVLTPELARVLLVDNDPTSRLTIQTILEAGGYHVESAASPTEAYAKMERREFELVLSDLGLGQQDSQQEAGYEVLAHARSMNYRPATALVTASYESSSPRSSSMLVEPEDVEGLLTKVANLIGTRVSRRLSRELRLQTAAN